MVKQVGVVDVVENKAEKHPKDRGCEFSNSCVTCPLPYCKYEPEMRRRLLKQRRKQQSEEVLKLYRYGKTIQQIAEILGVSIRTIQRRRNRRLAG